ncbi:MAG: cellulase family glycosylhydrolase [Leptolyngbyaceae cyanobacterium bins.59]|nr:cellulase family glycosylhydrolase [Leptolyngbyaceae cyanobacterium bins.59]
MSARYAWIKKLTGLSLLSLTLMSSLNLPKTAIPIAQAQTTSGFTVRNGRIYAPDGSEFIAKGTNANGPNWMWHGSTADDADLITNCWKFNLVRANSILFPDWYHRQDNNDLDRLVNTFTSRKVVVMFEAHDRTGSYFEGTDLEALKNWYRGLATRYKNNPYVWFNVSNEPDGDWENGYGAVLNPTRWLKMHQEVIKVIRDEVGANNIIVADGTTWGQDTGLSRQNNVSDQQSAILGYGQQLQNFNGKTYSNIIFGVHVYQEWNYGDAKMENFVDRARAKGLALIFGEYAMENWAGSSQKISTQPATETMLRVANSRGVGRVVWAWNGGNDSDAVQNDLTTGISPNGPWSGSGGGKFINSCTNPTNLTWLGQKVWADTRAAAVVSPTPAPVTPIQGTDLVITDLKVKQSTFQVGDRVQFEMTVKNQGSVATPSAWLGNAIQVDGVKVDWSGMNTMLAPGESKVFTSQGWTVTKTSFALSALVDDYNMIRETDESNNTRNVTVPSGATVTLQSTTSVPGIDLVVAGLKVKQTSFQVGERVQFEVTLKNQGTTATPSAWLGDAIYVDGEKVDWVGANGTLAPGESRVFTSQGWIATKTSFALSSMVDDFNLVQEANETNNTLQVKVGS